MRMKNGATDASLDRAFNEGKILRTHVMRPTWHFVTPADICWMLELTAPRVRRAMANMDRKLGLDREIIKKSNATLKKALGANQGLMRSELVPILEKEGISVEGYRLGQLMGHAELDGVICSGPRKGKQFTYALLEQRAHKAKKLQRDEALAELTRRYFRSHGPATLQDFVWWSGLTMTDARKGIEAVGSEFEKEILDGQTYWFAPFTSKKSRSLKAYLLPNYDEYTVGYRDRSAIFDITHKDKLSAFRESVLTQVILIDGKISGTWKRNVKKRKVIVELAPFTKITKAHEQAVLSAAQRHGAFLGLPVEPVS
jgi:hypothetical protein